MEDTNTTGYDVPEEEEGCTASRQFVGSVFKGIGKAGDAFLSGMALAMRETGKHAKITRLKMKLPKLQHSLQKLHLALGRTIYEQIKQEEEDILEQESIVEIVDQIRKSEKRISKVKKRIANVKEAAKTEAQEAVVNGSTDMEALFDLVRNGNDEQRYNAISNIAQLGDEETTAVLVGALGDKNPRVRLCALRGLYRLNTEESMSFLLDALSDGHPDVRSSAATYLGWAGDTAYSNDIARLLGDGDSQVRRSAAIALGNLAPESSVDVLVDTLSGRVGPLIDVLSDEDVGVRQQTVIALRRITHQFFGFRASSSEEERTQAIVGWRSWWADHQEMLSEEQAVTEEPSYPVEDTEEQGRVEEQEGIEEAIVCEEPCKSGLDDEEAGGLRIIRDRTIELGAGCKPDEEAPVEMEVGESEEETQEEEDPAGEEETPEAEMQVYEAPVEVEVADVEVEVTEEVEEEIEVEEEETEDSEEETSEEEDLIETEVEQEQDDAESVTAFINERCEFVPEGRVERKVLYGAHENYCADRGLDVMNRIAFYGQIRAYSDIEEESEGREYYFTGVQLREE